MKPRYICKLFSINASGQATLKVLQPHKNEPEGTVLTTSKIVYLDMREKTLETLNSIYLFGEAE